VIIVDPMLRGARDFDEAVVVTWVKNTGGQDLKNLGFAVMCDHDYEGLETHLDGDSSLLKKGDAIPLVLKFKELDKVSKETYVCIVNVVSEEPHQVFERQLTVRFI
jgi:hypothetical protein